MADKPGTPDLTDIPGMLAKGISRERIREILVERGVDPGQAALIVAVESGDRPYGDVVVKPARV